MKRAGAVCCFALAALIAAVSPSSSADADATLAARDHRLLDAAFAAMPAQRPGRSDLYVVGFAGDGHEDVFRNEVLYLDVLMSTRFDARGRVVTLVNHAGSLGATPRPLATLDNLRGALARIGRAMDRDQDLLLLFVTTHGTSDHKLVLQLYPLIEGALTPEQLRAALDDAGIRHRVLVVSACYAGGFVPALRGPDTLVIAAARFDRTSFGCGSESAATYFGRAWMIEGLNRSTSFIAAYDYATRRIAQRERAEDYEPSLPQIAVGANIGRRLRDWEATLSKTAAVPYPYVEKPD
ncbi:MAG: C13 family peptidase [Luteimonas sp.]